jgi:hypothetical protein
VSPHAATSPAATVAPSTAAAKPLTKDEMKRLEKAREEERKAEEKRLKEEEKAAKQAKKDAEKAMKDVEKAARPSKQW